MARILKREAAKRDLVAQWVWYAENAGTETADRFLEAAEKTLVLLADQLEVGARALSRRVKSKLYCTNRISVAYDLNLFPAVAALVDEAYRSTRRYPDNGRLCTLGTFDFRIGMT